MATFLRPLIPHSRVHPAEPVDPATHAGRPGSGWGDPITLVLCNFDHLFLFLAYLINFQMGREKVSSRGKEIRSESSEEEDEEIEEFEERSSGEEFGIHVHEKRTKPLAPPSRAQGRGRGHDGNPILKRKTTTVDARTKRASAAAEVGDRYDDNIDLSIYEQMAVPVHRPEHTRRDPPLVNFMKAGTDMRSLRFWPEDPRRLQ
jgi:hypothetical protein